MADVVRDTEWQDDYYHTLNFGNLAKGRLVGVSSAMWGLYAVDGGFMIKDWLRNESIYCCFIFPEYFWLGMILHLAHLICLFNFIHFKD